MARMTGQMYVRFLDKLSRHWVLRHLVFWLAVIVFCFFVFRDGRSPLRTLAINLGFLPGHILFVYCLNYILFPEFVLKRKFFSAFVGLIVILALALFYLRFADVYIVHFSGVHRLLVPSMFPRSIYALFSIGWIAVTIRLVKYWYREKEKQQQLEKEKLAVELQLLKSQLHPHFLFNTLNNLYSLTLERSQDAPRAVLQLSSLLRYILYECSQPGTPLSHEIGIITDYIELEQMRFREKLDISLQFTGNIRDKHIAPLLLLPFVENSVKHSSSEQLDKSWLSLHLHVEDEWLSFKLSNSRDTETPPGEKKQGLGLQNIRRRLKLLYPDRHTLKIISDEDTFTVSLTLRLSGQTEAGSLNPLAYHETQMSPG